jgi:hypothetical protein
MASNALTNTVIQDTYTGVLHARGQQLPATGQRDIYDGAGQKSAIKLGIACNGVTICGTLSADTMKTTTLSADNIKIGPNNIIDKIYPVNSIVFNTGVNPSTYLENTTWEQVAQGKFIVGEGTGVDQNSQSRTFSVGNNLGEYTHTLTVSEMPSHSHDVRNGSGGSSTNPLADSKGFSGMNRNGNIGSFAQIIRPVGGSQAHNITSPSFGLFIWQRLT